MTDEETRFGNLLGINCCQQPPTEAEPVDSAPHLTWPNAIHATVADGLGQIPKPRAAGSSPARGAL